ncbi:MAG: M23 family metallopeptidase [Sphingomonas fennica]
MTWRRAAAVAGPAALAACVPPPVVTTPPPPPQVAPPAPRLLAGDFRLDRAPAQGGIAFGTLPPGLHGLTLDGRPVGVAPDGRFLIGFGRDHGPVALLEARTATGDIVRQPLAVMPRAWDVQSLPTLRRGTSPSAAFLARRKPELEQIAAARALRSGSDGWRQRFVWPVTGRISGIFGSQRIYAGEKGDFHGGVDVARPTGTPIVAPADGVVVLAAAAPFTLEGNLLIVDHGMGLTSAFLHLSRIDVGVGQRVRQGQPLGAIGATGRVTGPHLHWALVWDGQRIDPQPIVGPMG